jgi:hypothetical protein
MIFQRRQFSTRMVLYSALVIVAAIGLFRLQFVILNEDVTFLILAAERLISGGKFGSEVLEVNTPIAVLIYLPAALLHRLTLWRIDFVSDLLTAIEVLALVLFANRLLRRALEGDQPSEAHDQATFITAATIYALLLPAYQFGQRDYLVIALLLPYLALITGLRRNRPMSRGSAILVGVLAGLALMIKPHYVLVLPALWWPRWRGQRLGVLVRSPDVLAVIATGILLSAVSLLLFSEWIGVAVLAMRYYVGTSRPLFDLILEVAQYDTSGWGAYLLALLAWRYGASIPSALRDFIGLLLKVAPVLLLVFFVQKKGFAYHLVPFDTVSMVAALTAGFGILSRFRAGIVGAAVMSGGLSAVMALATWSAAAQRVAPADVAAHPMLRAIVASDRGGGISFLSTSHTPAIHATVLFGTQWGLRSAALWALPAIEIKLSEAGISLRDLKPAVANDQLVADAIWYRHSIVADLIHYRPDIVVVLRSDRSPDATPDLHILDFLSGDPAFSQVWRQFTPAGVFEVGDRSYDFFVRRASSSG